MTSLVRILLVLATIALAPAASAQGAPPAPLEVEEPVPGPPPSLPDLTEPNSRSAESLDEPGLRSTIPKSLRSSGTQAGGPANDLNPSGQREGPASPRGNLANVLTGAELFHGNYCGAGQRGEGLPPIDDLDAACQRHDACFDAAAHRSCACNAVLKREAAAVSERPGIALEVRRRALSVVQAAEVMACETP
ncbi:hypothetical protein [Methylobacterium segetis]|uniref:hypothetical protein n=1 Tax=Methylobacterium segetis TaxID=2488750 RepID=UPI003CCA6EC2